MARASAGRPQLRDVDYGARGGGDRRGLVPVLERELPPAGARPNDLQRIGDARRCDVHGAVAGEIADRESAAPVDPADAVVRERATVVGERVLDDLAQARERRERAQRRRVLRALQPRSPQPPRGGRAGEAFVEGVVAGDVQRAVEPDETQAQAIERDETSPALSGNELHVQRYRLSAAEY